MSASEVRVVKVGGSLLDVPNLGERLVSWVSQQPSAVNLFVVGGGGMVDAVRDLDSKHHFDANFVHWHCVDLLDKTSAILNELLPRSLEHRWIRLRQELGSFLDSGDKQSPSVAVVSPAAFYVRGESEELLPSNWSTTTDSISALLAMWTSAAELVLLKSAEPPSAAPSEETDEDGGSELWTKLAEFGYVDANFPRIASCVQRIRCVNFRGF